jgi:hypothetical protein
MAVLVVQGILVGVIAVSILLVTFRQVMDERYQLFSIFLTLPNGCIRALASKQVTIDDASSDDDDDDGGVGGGGGGSTGGGGRANANSTIDDAVIKALSVSILSGLAPAYAATAGCECFWACKRDVS